MATYELVLYYRWHHIEEVPCKLRAHTSYDVEYMGIKIMKLYACAYYPYLRILYSLAPLASIVAGYAGFLQDSRRFSFPTSS